MTIEAKQDMFTIVYSQYCFSYLCDQYYVILKI